MKFADLNFPDCSCVIFGALSIGTRSKIAYSTSSVGAHTLNVFCGLCYDLWYSRTQYKNTFDSFVYEV